MKKKKLTLKCRKKFLLDLWKNFLTVREIKYRLLKADGVLEIES